MDRAELTELIATTRAQKGLTWSEVADAVGASKEWVTAGCLGQMTFDAAQAATLVAQFELPTEALKLLQTRPHRGSLSTPVPTDPLIYRFASWSACTAPPSTSSEDPAGDRVNLSMSGRFLPDERY